MMKKKVLIMDKIPLIFLARVMFKKKSFETKYSLKCHLHKYAYSFTQWAKVSFLEALLYGGMTQFGANFAPLVFMAKKKLISSL